MSSDNKEVPSKWFRDLAASVKEPFFEPRPIIHRCGPSDCQHDYQGCIPIVDEDGRVTGGTAVCTKCGCSAINEAVWS